MNDISFSSADTQGWNNAAGNTPVSSGNYNMQQIPTYSEYLGLPFKLEAGTNAISIANQHQVRTPLYLVIIRWRSFRRL